MANGGVDRQEWALVVQELLDAEREEGGRGSKTRFAEKAGINVRTLAHWLAGADDQSAENVRKVAVSEASVRKVAKAYGLKEMELLIRVGVYDLEQMPRISPEQFNAERLLVLDSDLDDDQKAYILQELDKMEAEDQQALAAILERDRRRRRERVEALLNQRRSA